jgi:hypothetical protein
MGQYDTAPKIHSFENLTRCMALRTCMQIALRSNSTALVPAHYCTMHTSTVQYWRARLRPAGVNSTVDSLTGNSKPHMHGGILLPAA